MPVRVVLEAAAGGLPMGRDQIVTYFVVIEGVPGSNGLVITNAKPLAQAERLRAKVEAALRAYPFDPPKAGDPTGVPRYDREFEVDGAETDGH